MIILQFVLIVSPGILAAYFYEYLSKQEMRALNLLFDISKFTLLIFFASNIVEYLRGWKEFDWTRFSVQFLVKYLLFITVLIFVLPVVNVYVDKKLHKK